MGGRNHQRLASSGQVSWCPAGARRRRPFLFFVSEGMSSDGKCFLRRQDPLNVKANSWQDQLVKLYNIARNELLGHVMRSF